jgi:hypothetical protein
LRKVFLHGFFLKVMNFRNVLNDLNVLFCVELWKNTIEKVR